MKKYKSKLIFDAVQFLGGAEDALKIRRLFPQFQYQKVRRAEGKLSWTGNMVSKFFLLEPGSWVVTTSIGNESPRIHVSSDEDFKKIYEEI